MTLSNSLGNFVFEVINSVLIAILLAATIIINLFLSRDIMIFNKISLLKLKRYLYIIFYILQYTQLQKIQNEFVSKEKKATQQSMN